MRTLFPVALALGLALAGCGTSGSTASNATSTPAAVASNNASAPGGQNHVHSIVIAAGNPNDILLGTHYHLYASSDGGLRWRPLSNQMMLSLAVDPSHPSTLFAVSSQRGLQKSVDGGLHWRRSASGIPAHSVVGVVTEPRAHDVLAYGLGIYWSGDGGGRWTRVLAGTSTVSSIAIGAGGHAYAASTTGLYTTDDSGLHWKPVASVGGQPIIQVAGSRGVAYAVSPVSILKSVNGGRTWRALARAPQGIEFIGVSPSDPRELFGEIGGQGFVMSHDGGATWHRANNGLHDRDFNASTIRVAPSAPGVVYTGAWGLHFYASRDGGRHWTQVATLVH